MGFRSAHGDGRHGPVRKYRGAAARRRCIVIASGIVGGVLLLAGVLTIAIVALPQKQVEPVATTGSSVAALVPSNTVSLPVASSSSSTTSTTEMNRYTVVIDPGHQGRANSDREPIGPGSAQTKAKVSSGTSSINTGSPESALVLTIGLKLRDSLETEGIEVIMTRTSQDVDISNVQRAELANQAEADLFVRIHADGATDRSIHGILLLYPSSTPGWTDDIAADSKRAAELALDRLLASTGARSRGMIARSDLTGFNWSDVPVILPEIGLMTNAAEDALLASEEYQDKIVQGLTDAILDFLQQS